MMRYILIFAAATLLAYGGFSGVAQLTKENKAKAVPSNFCNSHPQHWRCVTTTATDTIVATTEPAPSTVATTDTTTTDTTATTTAPTTPTTYIFQDEFNGTSLDTTKWQKPGSYCYAPNDYSCNKDENVFLDGQGDLVLRTKREPSNYLTGGPFSAAWVETYKYGWGWPATGVLASWSVPFKYEYRVKFADVVPSWANGGWVQSVDKDESQSAYQLDAGETVTSHPGSIGCHQHTWLNGIDRAGVSGSINVADVRYNWHVVSVSAYTDRTVYEVDGNICATHYGVSGRFGAILHSGIASQSVTWASAGLVVDSSDPGPWDMLVDYVRVTSLG